MNENLIIYWKELTLILGIYFMPTIFSMFNKKSKTFGIFVFNLIFGWTILGWISALFEAFKDPSISRYENYPSNEKMSEEIEKKSPIYIGIGGSDNMTIFIKTPKK